MTGEERRRLREQLDQARRHKLRRTKEPAEAKPGPLVIVFATIAKRSLWL